MPKHSEILDALTARREWENRQAVWYQMRHDGIRRSNKPFKGAADMHFRRSLFRMWPVESQRRR